MTDRLLDDPPRDAPPEDCVWSCGRGRTRMLCRLRDCGNCDFELEIVRNGRLYGTYRFVERAAACLFATRLRDALEGNAWTAA